MGVAAINVAAVELFDEMNTVNEKYAKFLASDDCLVFFLIIIALAVGFMATDMVDEVRELPYEYDYKKQDDDLPEYEEVKEIGIIEQLRGPRTRLEDSMEIAPHLQHFNRSQKLDKGRCLNCQQSASSVGDKFCPRNKLHTAHLPVYSTQTLRGGRVADMDALSYIWPLEPEVTNKHINEASAATSEVIRAATSWANEVHLSLSGIRGNLSGIRENTSRYLFWTILVCIIITSVLLLHTLNSLWYQLSELNMHQSTYKEMWIEERSEMVQQLKHEEESRNAMFNMLIRQIREANRTQRQPAHHPTRQWIDSQQQQSRSPQQQREPLLSGSLERKMRAAIRNSNAMDDLSD